MSEEQLKPTGLYKADSKGKWPCPGGYCSHFRCIVEYETTFIGKKYYIGKNQN